MSEGVIINNHELCKRILSNIDHLRDDLKKLEDSNKALFDGDDPLVQSSWEFWNTDEILEHIGSEIGVALRDSERIVTKKLYANE